MGRYVFYPENTTKDSFKDLAHLPSFGTQMESVAVFQLCSDPALHGYCAIMSMTGSAVVVKKRAAFLYCFDRVLLTQTSGSPPMRTHSCRVFSFISFGQIRM